MARDAPMIHEALAVGPFQCNCHILADPATKEAVIVDPGDDAGEILARVRDLGVTVKALVHTHCHLDHIVATRRLREETGARILIHEADQWLYENLKMQIGATLKLFGVRLGEADDPLPVDEFLRDGHRVTFGAHALQAIHTPGHTPGSCCFLLEHPAGRACFSGDTLFAGSIGRTDLWGGDAEQELASIRARLFTLDGETVVYPGHGPETMIREEKKYNPFLQ